MTDTGNFRFENTSPNALRVAADLVENGANPNKIYKYCYESKTKNLVMFHDCGIEIDGTMVYGLAAISYLNRRLKEYQGEGWRMFALMKKVIADNNFDFKARMSEIYGK